MGFQHPAQGGLEGGRKQVRVLLADLKGSMELLADRDPEEARKLLDPVLERRMGVWTRAMDFARDRADLVNAGQGVEESRPSEIFVVPQPGRAKQFLRRRLEREPDGSRVVE